MSEITTLRPGTREYYDSRQMPENPRKIELLKILEERIWREVAAQLPESEMPTEVEFSDPRLLGKHTEWFLAYHKRDKNTLIERVKNNVQSSYSEQLL